MHPIHAVRNVLLVAAALCLAAAVRAFVVGPLNVELAALDLGPLGSSTLGLSVNEVSGPLLVLVVGLGAVVATYSSRNLVGQRGANRFAGLLALAISSLAVSVSATTLPLLAAGWTVGGLAIAALVAHPGTSQAQEAARLVRSRLLVGDVFLWSGVVASGVLLGALDLDQIATAVGSAPQGSVELVALLMVGAMVVRSALFPAHRWLPETAQAPSPVSGLLHAGLVNGVGVLSLAVWPLLSAAPVAAVVLIGLGAATVVLGTFQSRVRSDVKGRLAASTSAQMGFVGVTAGLGLPAAVLAHVVGHGFWKAGLFLGAGGAVQRARAASATRPAEAGRIASVVALVLGMGVAIVAAWVPGPWGESLLAGPADLIPVTLAGLTAGTVLAVALGGQGRARFRGAVAALLGAAAYIVAVRSLSHSLSEGWAMAPSWGQPGAVADALLLVGLAALAVAIWRVDVAAKRGKFSGLASRVSATSLPPVPVAHRFRGLSRPEVQLTQPPAASADEVSRVVGQVGLATAAVAPSWPLGSFVASNPLAGLEDLPMSAALSASSATWGTGHGPDAAVIADAMDSGRITAADLQRAATSLGADLGPDISLGGHGFSRAEVLAAMAQIPLTSGGEEEGATGWATERARNFEMLSCARLLGDPLWPAQPLGLWGFLKSQAGLLDGSLRVRGAGRWIADQPDDAAAALAGLLTAARIPDSERVQFMSRLLARDPGWAAHVAWRVRQGVPGAAAPAADPSSALLELVAVRVALEVLCARAEGRSVSGWLLPSASTAPSTAVAAEELLDLLGLAEAGLEPRERTELARFIAGVDAGTLAQIRLLALEESWREPMLAEVEAHQRAAKVSGEDKREPAAAQAIFCIDVRSERLRRHLEGLGPWGTLGAAGFFGLPLRHVDAHGSSSDRCPALLMPARTVAAGDFAPAESMEAGVHAVEMRPVLPFAWAEAAGWITGPVSAFKTVAPRIAGSLAGRAHRKSLGSPLAPIGVDRFSFDEAVDAAEGFLRSLGLIDPAQVVLLVGHGATVANNPHAAAYDCGACGGWSGEVNARAMAEVLNDGEVRRVLSHRGIGITPRTAFVAALHNTTVDRIELVMQPPAWTDRALLDSLMSDMAAAGRATAEERAARQPFVGGGKTGKKLLDRLAARSLDWAEPRPEWGLAGNAALVIGPRAVTEKLDLDGRVFLQSYAAETDPDGSILESLMAAPLVVAQWINAQYWCSTVEPNRWGAGDKTTHNVVAPADGGPGVLTGVLTGARGDLRIGLPWQGVGTSAPASDGFLTGTVQHEPLRLMALICAETSVIDDILTRLPGVAKLVLNEWISLAAVDPVSGWTYRFKPQEGWVAAGAVC